MRATRRQPDPARRTACAAPLRAAPRSGRIGWWMRCCRAVGRRAPESGAAGRPGRRRCLTRPRAPATDEKSGPSSTACRPADLPMRRAQKNSPDEPATAAPPIGRIPAATPRNGRGSDARSRRGWFRRRTPQNAGARCPPGWGAGGGFPGPSGLYVHSSGRRRGCQYPDRDARPRRMRGRAQRPRNGSDRTRVAGRRTARRRMPRQSVASARRSGSGGVAPWKRVGTSSPIAGPPDVLTSVAADP